MTQPLFSNAGFEQPIEIRKGVDFLLQLKFFQGELNGEPFDLTGCDVRARLIYSGTGAAWDFTTPDFSATAAAGVCDLVLPVSITNTLVESPTSKMAKPDYTWYCDVKLADNTIVPFCQGPATVIKGSGINWS